MKHFLDKGLWISLFLLFPITLIGLFSQNSIPGDILYPVKVGIESVGLFVFSLTPEAKASYNSTLTERRLEEAQKMIIYDSNTKGLDTLVEQTAKTQESVTNIENPEQKQVLEEKLISEIDDYGEKLTQTQQRVDPSFIPPPTPTPTLTPTPIKENTIQSRFVLPTPTLIFAELSPSPTPTPSFPNIPQTPPNIISNIEITKKKLEGIKKQVQIQNSQTKLQLQLKSAQKPSKSPSPTPLNKVNKFKNKKDTTQKEIIKSDSKKTDETASGEASDE